MKYKSPNEIVDELLKKLSRKDRETLLNIRTKNDLIVFHSNLGMHIRNLFLMWDENNPYTDISDSMSDKFPDQISQYIIDSIWERVVKK